MNKQEFTNRHNNYKGRVRDNTFIAELNSLIQSECQNHNALIDAQSDLITLLKRVTRAEDLPRNYNDLNDKIKLLKQQK